MGRRLRRLVPGPPVGHHPQRRRERGAGPGKFVPEYSEFWLYPTWVHQAEQGLRGDAAQPRIGSAKRPEAVGSIPIRGLVRVDQIGRVESEKTLPALEEFHTLTSETILKRFHYRKPGLWVLGARVWLRDSALPVVATPEHAGCKTWVILDQPIPTSGLSPVLDERQWTEHQSRLRSILASEDMTRPSRPIDPTYRLTIGRPVLGGSRFNFLKTYEGNHDIARDCP